VAGTVAGGKRTSRDRQRSRRRYRRRRPCGDGAPRWGGCALRPRSASELRHAPRHETAVARRLPRPLAARSSAPWPPSPAFGGGLFGIHLVAGSRSTSAWWPPEPR